MTKVYSDYTLSIMNEINQKLNSIMSLAQRLESEPKKFGTNVLLTGTDIHLIEIIGDNDNSSVTEIARRAGVTKGAVSQKLKQLESKRIVRKGEDPANISRSIVTLTSKGSIAYFAHKHWHETMDGGFEEYYKSLSSQNIRIIIQFLTKMESLLVQLLAVED